MNIPAKTGDVEIHGNFIDGREVEAGHGEMLDVRNPATGDVIARIPNSTKEDIDRAMKSARLAFEGKEWGGMDVRSRARLVNRLADAFEANLGEVYRVEGPKNRTGGTETRARGWSTGSRMRSRPIWSSCTGWRRSTTAGRSTRPARSSRGCRTSSAISQ